MSESDQGRPELPRPLASVPMAPHGHQIQTAHRTVLPEDDSAAVQELAEILQESTIEGRSARLRLSELCSRHPSFLDGWARLGQAAYLADDNVVAYSCARVGYHRGLDRLRKAGWGGTGQVRWADQSNRGFLRSLHLLMLAAAAIEELDEMERCHQFLLDLDPEDGIAAGQETVPGNRRTAAQLP